MKEEVLQEIKEKRTSRSKHFKKQDGTFVARLYSDEVHYLKDGRYEEISNKLVKKNNRIENEANDFKVSFAEKSERNLLELTKDDKKLKMGLKNFKVKSSKTEKVKSDISLAGKIDYSDILENIDLSYEIFPRKIKESIILRNKKAIDEELIFTLDIPDLNLVLNEDKTISLLSNNEEKFKIEAPYMIDLKGNRNDNIHYEVLKGNEIKLVLDEKWLKSSDREYPVVVDPTILVNTSDDPAAMDITLVSHGIITLSPYTLSAGVAKHYNQECTFRSLLKFNLPNINAGDEIIDAKLCLGAVYDQYNVVRKFWTPITVHMVTTDWNTTNATWASMSDNYDSRIEACNQYYKTIYDNDIIKNEFDITNLVKRWYSGTPNHGILMKALEEEYKDMVSEMSFYSRAAGLNNLGGASPIIEINYRNQNGIEPYLTYQKQDFKNMKTYVSNNNGNLTAIYDVIATKSSKFPVFIQLVYNTNDCTENFGYGNGIRLNYAQEIDDSDENKINYIDTDGTIHYFQKITEEIYDEDGNVEIVDKGYFEDEDGMTLRLEKVDNDWIMTDKYGNKSKFIGTNNRYFLREIEDAEGNIITINLTNNRITSITDGGNETITINYNSNSIEFVSTEKTVVATISNNNIVSINSNGSITSIVYNPNNTINKITDISGKSIGYEYYDKANRVKTITEYGLNNEVGNSLEMIYGFQSTTIKDSKERYNTYTFNEWGNVVSMSNLASQEDVKDAYGVSMVYGKTVIDEELKSDNKVALENELVKSVNNYILDSSFEKSTLLNKTFISLIGPNQYISTTDARTGKKCLAIEFSGQNTLTTDFYRRIDVPTGKYYTFSAYMKTSSYDTGGVARLGISYLDNNNEEVKAFSSNMPESTKYTRYKVTAFYPETATALKIFISFEGMPECCCYFDDFQLEEGEIANLYNLVNNSDFAHGMTSWESSSIFRNYSIDSSEEDYEIPNNDEIITLPNGKTAYKMKCYPKHVKTLLTRFNTSGTYGDVYNLSFWYKNSGITVDYAGPSMKNSVFLDFKYIVPEGDGFGTHQDVIKLNSNNTEWQFFSENIYAEYDYDYDGIELEFFSECNANDLIITNVSLFKDLGASTYTRDEKGNIVASTDSNNQTTEYKYNESNQLESVVDPNGYNLKYEYDSEITTRLLKSISNTGISNEVNYNEEKLPVKSIITNRGDTNIVDTDKLYYIRQKGTDKYLKLNPIGRSVTLVNKKDVYGEVKFNLVEENQYTITSSVFNHFLYHQENIIKYAPNNTVKKIFEVISNDNGTITIKPFSLEKQYLSIDNDIASISDTVGEFYLEEVKPLLFIESSIEYTESGNFISKKTDSLGNITIYDIDETTGLINSITDAKNNIIEYEYNNSKLVTKVINGDQEVEYEYENNSLSKIIHGTKEYNFTYDNFFNIKEIDINNNTLIENEYEEQNGNIIKSIYGNGDEIEYEYDSFDRLSKLIKSDNTYIHRYDNLSNIREMVNSDGIMSFDYDLNNRLVKVKHNDDLIIEYKYDEKDNVSEKVINDDVYSYLFDAENLLSKVNYGNQEIDYIYDELGRIKNKKYNDSYIVDYHYITDGNRTSELLKSITDNFGTISHEYDKLNNIIKTFVNNDLIKEYEYDVYNQLIKDYDYSKNETTDYVYDNFGNILSKTKYSIDTNVLLNEDLYEYNNINWEDQLTRFNNTSLTYDNIGNPLTIGNINLTWINGRELATYSDSTNNLNISYKYNNSNIRTEKTVNGNITKYLLEGKSIVQEIRPGNINLKFVHDDCEVIGIVYNNQQFFYQKNMQCDIIGLLDDEFNKIATYEYDSWGNILSVKDAIGNDIVDNTHIAHINPFRYHSYYYDVETKLYYLNSRYYNPEWERFITADNYVNTKQAMASNNMYSYTENNPINRTDADGQVWLLVMIVIGVTTGVVVNGVSNVMQGKDFADGIWGAAAAGALSGAIATTPLAFTLGGQAIVAYGGVLLESSINEGINAEKNGYYDFGVVMQDTIFYGSVSFVTSIAIPNVGPKLNKGWLRPKTPVTSLTGNYTRKVAIKNFVETVVSEATAVAANKVINKNTPPSRQAPVCPPPPKDYCERPKYEQKYEPMGSLGSLSYR